MESSNEVIKSKISYFERVKTSLEKQFNKKLRAVSVDLTEIIDIYQRDVDKSSNQIEKAVSYGRLTAAQDIAERIKWHIPDFKLGEKRSR